MNRSTLWRYVLFQIPGMAVTGGILALLVLVDVISPFWAWTAFGLWCLKDVVLYPLTWRAYVVHAPVGDERLLGNTGIALTELGPEGKVRIGGEIWNAVAEDGAAIAPGTPVEVKKTKGLTLTVAPLK